MYNLIRLSGLTLLLMYCFFNLGNVLYFKVSVDFIGLVLLALAGLYFVQRTATATVNGLQIRAVEVSALCLLGAGFAALILQRILYDSYIGFDGVDTHQSLTSLWIVSMLWFLIGGSASAATLKESPALALLIGGGITAMMAFGVDAELFKAFSLEDFSDKSTRVSHLTVERYIVIPIILAYALSPKTRWIVAICGIYCLFLLGGRTALFVFIITIALMNLTGNPVRNILVMIVMGAVLFFGLRYAVGNGILDVDNRQVKEILFLGGVAEDNSYNARVQLLQQSLQDLPQQFLVGNFSITVERYGGFGTYIHNLLSAWQFYGFFVFLAIIASLVYCFFKMVGAMARTTTPMVIFSSFLLVYVIISVIVGKYVGWTMLWMAMGVWMLQPATHVIRAGNSSRGSGKRRRRRRRVSQSLASPT